MTRIAYDSQHGEQFTVNVFDVSDISEIADSEELYRAFESGWPVVIKGLTIPGVDYDYYDDLPDWVIEDNKWIMPWYNSHIKKRDRLRDERNWTEEQIDEFTKKHRKANKGWDIFFNTLFPRYKDAQERCLSHRYNMLVENKLHLDELCDTHTGEDQQIRMFVQLDKKRPRVLTFGPDLEQMYNQYYDKFNLWELDSDNVHEFITEMRNRCIWNEERWDQFHHPLHYITFDPGDIWMFNAQWITHQIIFGSKLQCYEADIPKDNLLDPSLSMKDRISKFTR